uniref:Myoneurin n=1 Tax=Phallusia mammillata TaxID=59560 RepID=A0A6F9DMD1_9ASCI|nr:myoneurin [Phallusia mammillata]
MIYASPDYCQTALKLLNELRQNNEFCDITVDIDGTKYTAHKSVLVAGSQYMRQHLPALSENFIQLNLKLTITDIFEHVLNFLYTGEIALTNGNVAELTMLGSYLQITELTWLTVQFLNGMQIQNGLGCDMSPAVQVIVQEEKSLDDLNQTTSEPDDAIVACSTPKKKIKKESYKVVQTLHLNSKLVVISERKMEDEKDDFNDTGSELANDTIMQSDDDIHSNHNSPTKISSLYTFDEKLDKYECIICGKMFNRKTSCVSHCKTHSEFVDASLVKNERKKPVKTSSRPHRQLTMKDSIILRKRLMSKPYLSRTNISNGLLFKCDICWETFRKFDSFKEHRMLSHEIDEIPKCWVCEDVFQSGDDLAQHVPVHYFKEGQNFQKKSKPKTLPKILPCLLCDEQFAEQVDLQQHLETMHEEDWPITCNDCNITFESHHDSSLSLHIQSYHSMKEKPPTKKEPEEFLCTECGLIFRLQEIYEEHVASRCAHRGHVCQICSRSFTSPQGLKRHHKSEKFSCGEQIKKWRLDNDKIDVRKVKSQEHVLEYLCTDCNSGFHKFDEFYSHRLEIHNTSEEMRCRFCDFVANYKSQLDKHVYFHAVRRNCARVRRRYPSLTEDGKWTCIVCEAIFEHESDYRFHKTLRCAIKCRFCKFSSGRKKLLRSHISRHLQNLPFPCLKCDMAFSRRWSLNKHMQKQHAVESLLNKSLNYETVT